MVPGTRMLAAEPLGVCQSNALAPCQVPGAKGICGFVMWLGTLL